MIIDTGYRTYSNSGLDIINRLIHSDPSDVQYLELTIDIINGAPKFQDMYNVSLETIYFGNEHHFMFSINLKDMISLESLIRAFSTKTHFTAGHVDGGLNYKYLRFVTINTLNFNKIIAIEECLDQPDVGAGNARYYEVEIANKFIKPLIYENDLKTLVEKLRNNSRYDVLLGLNF